MTICPAVWQNGPPEDLPREIHTGVTWTTGPRLWMGSPISYLALHVFEALWPYAFPYEKAACQEVDW